MTNTQTHTHTSLHIQQIEKTRETYLALTGEQLSFWRILEQNYSETDLFYNTIWNAARLDERFLTAAGVHNDRPSSRV